MKKNKRESIAVEDIPPEAFKDPIALLQKLKKNLPDRQNEDKLEDDLVVSTRENNDGLISFDDFVDKLNVQDNTVLWKIRTGKLIPAETLVGFRGKKEYRFKTSQLDYVKTHFGWKAAETDLYASFMDEVREMKMSYSYKPLLIKAIMAYADVDGSAPLSKIVDYYINYYSDRKERGLIVEKDDSTFVQNENDRLVAKKTILKYPYKRYAARKMMVYDQEADTIDVVPEVWDNISKKLRKDISSICDDQLEIYYSRVLKI